jgi:transposase
MKENCPQRAYALREIFHKLRGLIRASCSWRMAPNDLPPWTIIQQ